MNGCLSAAITVAMTLVITAAASADPIVITRDNRITSAIGKFTNASPREAIAQANDALVSTVMAPPGTSPGGATATLTSSIADPLHWFGAGTASTSWTGPAGSEYSTGASFNTAFQVTSPVSYLFNVNLAAASSGAFNTSRAEVDAFLIIETPTSSGPVFSFFLPPVSETNSSAGSRSFAGVLAPSNYHIFVNAGGRGLSSDQVRAGSTTANFAFAFDFSPESPAPTPEPASLLLLGTGIAGVFGFRSRREDRAA